MPDTLRDGRGRGYLCGVNSDNQQLTRSTTVEQRLESTLDENYYEMTTGSTTLTDATETGLLYLKNSDVTGKVIVIDRVFYDLWASTGGSGGATLKYYKNPTVTGGTSIDPVATNFASTKTPSGTFSKSVTSIDSGTVWWTAYVDASSSNALEEGRIVLTAGDSFLISLAAPTGNSSMAVSMNIAFYVFDKELI